MRGVYLVWYGCGHVTDHTRRQCPVSSHLIRAHPISAPPHLIPAQSHLIPDSSRLIPAPFLASSHHLRSSCWARASSLPPAPEVSRL